MQSRIQEPGIIAAVYCCNVCPYGCELKVHLKEGTKPFMHQHHCHYFPSLTTAWERIA